MDLIIAVLLLLVNLVLGSVFLFLVFQGIGMALGAYIALNYRARNPNAMGVFWGHLIFVPVMFTIAVGVYWLFSWLSNFSPTCSSIGFYSGSVFGLVFISIIPPMVKKVTAELQHY